MNSNHINNPNMKLEVVVFGVTVVDRAKAFYENLGWRLDGDVAAWEQPQLFSEEIRAAFRSLR